MRFAFTLPCLLALFVPVVLSANLRAPIIHDQQVSSALSGLHEGITVRSAHLRFDLKTDASTPPQESTCRIKAEYRIHSDDTHTITLHFLTPTDGEVLWQAGDQSGIARLEPEAVPEEGEADTPFAAKLYRAEFEMTLIAGDQSLLVEYDHIPGHRELEYGYFKSSRFIHHLSYALWPIKEWHLDDAFHLQLEATLDDPGTGWWARRKGRQDTLSLTDEKGVAFPADRKTQVGGALHASWEWTASSLPDTIRLYAGNADLMERAHGLKYPFP